jgi:hypothetical protein
MTGSSQYESMRRKNTRLYGRRSGPAPQSARSLRIALVAIARDHYLDAHRQAQRLHPRRPNQRTHRGTRRLRLYSEAMCEEMRGGWKMDEARWTGTPASASSCKAVKEVGTTTSGRMGQPQSSDVSRSSGGGVVGARGRREQLGPVQGQGCAGFAGTRRASNGLARWVRSMWLGNSQPARAAEGDKRATPSNASGTLTTRTRCRIEVRTSDPLSALT